MLNIFKSKMLVFLVIFLHLTSFSNISAYAKTPESEVIIASVSEGQKILAVADFSNDTGDSSMDYLKKGLANSLVTTLGMDSKNNFSIVERGQLESLIKEMGLSEGGLVDVSTATKLGSALGASQIIVGGLIKLGNTLRLNIRVIDVRTSRLLLAFSEYAENEGDVLKQLDKVSTKIVSELSGNKTNSPATNIPSLKIEDSQPGIPLWMWITGSALLAGAAVLTGVLIVRANNNNNTTTKTPTTTRPTIRN